MAGICLGSEPLEGCLEHILFDHTKVYGLLLHKKNIFTPLSDIIFCEKYYKRKIKLNSHQLVKQRIVTKENLAPTVTKVLHEDIVNDDDFY